MSDVLLVAMRDEVCGRLTRTTRGLRFEYEPDYQRSADATPLSVSMPIQVRAHADAAISPWLWGLLPDNVDVLDRWARQFQVSPSSPFALLSTPVGEDCAGAVRFIRPERAEAALTRSGSVRPLADDEIAERLEALVRDSTAWLGPDFSGQFSLAGAQAKTALHFDGARWGLPSGATPTTHILKPAIRGLDDHDLNEHLCLDAGSRAGLTVARTHITRFGGRTAVVVDRYDRRRVRRNVERIHQEDLCQALGLTPQRKYEADGGPSPRDIADLLRAVIVPARAAEAAVEALRDALAWNWIIAGTDAHAKNYSLLLAGDQVRFAPLYDVASALPYANADEAKLKLAMKLGGEYRLRLHTARTWSKVASELDLDGADTMDRVGTLAAAAPDAFAESARTAEVRALRRPLTKRLVDAVAKRAVRCAQLLDAPVG